VRGGWPWLARSNTAAITAMGSRRGRACVGDLCASQLLRI
jgi:hypothetical protein